MNSVDLGEATHNESPHPDLHCLQNHLFSSCAFKC